MKGQGHPDIYKYTLFKTSPGFSVDRFMEQKDILGQRERSLKVSPPAAIFHTKGHCCDIGGPYCGGLDCLMLHHTLMGEQKLCGVGHCLKADGLGWRTEGQILAIFFQI